LTLDQLHSPNIERLIIPLLDGKNHVGVAHVDVAINVVVFNPLSGYHDEKIAKKLHAFVTTLRIVMDDGKWSSVDMSVRSRVRFPGSNLETATTAPVLRLVTDYPTPRRSCAREGRRTPSEDFQNSNSYCGPASRYRARLQDNGLGYERGGEKGKRVP
jgi:hypothetical protein